MKFYCKETDWFSNKEVDTVQALGGIIKFINALNISQTSFVVDVELKKMKKGDEDYQLTVFILKASLLQKNIKQTDRKTY